MKSILDPDFKYRPSFDTDIKRRFERIERERREAKKKDDEKPSNVKQLKRGVG